MTVIQPNSISGITSITAQGDTINIYKSDGTTVGALNVNVNASSGVTTITTLNVGNGGTIITTTSGGSIGIGTTNPSSSVDIVRTSSGAGLRIKSTSNGANLALDSSSSGGVYSPQVTFLVDGSNKWAIGGSNIGAGSSTALSLYNYTGATGNVFTVDTNNNFMIGSVNATGTASQKLQVTGGAYVSGNLGIGTTSPNDILHLEGNIRLTGTDRFIQAVSTDLNLNATAGQNIKLCINGLAGEAARIDSSKRLLVGMTTARTDFASSTATPRIQQEATDYNGSSLSLVRNSNNAGNGELIFGKSRGTSLGGVTVVAADDTLGGIRFDGADGTDFATGALISAQVDGTPGNNDMPGRLVFSTTADGASSPTERMRIRNNGIVSINRGGDASPTSDPQQLFIGEGGTNTFAIMVMQTGGNSGASRDYIRFYNYLNQLTGSIQHTGATSVSYNTSSDYRLKENITPVSDGIERLLQLKPSRFNFIAEPEKTVDGFIAHEVQEVVPEAINGEKDGIDSDGNPVYQGIDQSKLVPLLTAALQEAVAKIESLEARLTAAGI